MKVFLCSDFTLTDAEILEHYTHRWKIEVMFKQQKRYLGLKSFMIRTAMAIDRFRIILTVAWFFLTCKEEFPSLSTSVLVAIGAFCLFYEFAHLEYN